MESFFKGRVHLHCGDCLKILKTLPANSVDAVVCDPPYHLTSIVKRFGADNAKPALSAAQRRFAKTGGGDRLPGSDQYGRLSTGFMGKKWDGGTVAFEVATWKEVYRVLKPGGHLVAFGGTRTYHRMACAVEDAGFEVRDMVSWIFGSGFPKSHDVSKGIDGLAGAKRENNYKSTTVRETANSASHRGTHVCDNCGKYYGSAAANCHCPKSVPATAEAAQWAGFGTALKPAVEPVVWATKKFTAVPDYATLAEFSSSVEALLWSMLSAKSAESLSRLRRQDCSAAECGSVRLVVVLLDMLRLHGLSVTTAMFRSPEVASISLSIVLLWDAILAVSSPSASTFTTATAASLTTGLKTLNSWILAITPDYITQAAKEASGVWLDVSSAKNLSSDLKKLSAITRKHSAAAPASSNIIQSILFTLANLVAESSALSQATIEGFVLRLAQTVSTTTNAQSDENIRAPTVAPFLRLSPVELQNTVAENAWQKPTGGLSPSAESACLARKPLSERTVAKNVLRWGTGAINVGACRVETSDNLNGGTYASDTVTDGISGSMAGPLHNAIGKQFVQPTGRWPANVIIDGSEEVVDAFPNSVSGRLEPYHDAKESANGSMSGKNYAGRIKSSFGGDSGSAARFFFSAKADSEDRIGFKHPTIKPVDLMQYLVRLVTPPPRRVKGELQRRVVLDLFAGTGTTGEAAFREGANAILIEAEPEYQEYIRQRMAMVLSSKEKRVWQAKTSKGRHKPRKTGFLKGI